jgi:Fe-S oxidoreductase
MSHFRQFTPAEWQGRHFQETAFSNAVFMNQRGVGPAGVVNAHCAGTPDEWEERYGKYGHFTGYTLADLPAVDRNAILRREIEEDDPEVPGQKRRRRIRMTDAVPVGATSIAENLVPHVWLGETTEEVRG